MVGDARRRAAGPGGRRRGRQVLGSRPAYSVRIPAGLRPETVPVPVPVPVPVAERTVPWLRVGAAYAWRLILVGIAVYGVFSILGSFQLIAVALFLALVVTSVLRPLTDLLGRILPRSLAVAMALLGSVLLLLGLLALVAVSYTHL